MPRRKVITLTLTRACNLSCVYCYESNKSALSMDEETVCRILDEALNDDTFDEFEIDFFGGEPFLRFDLIKVAIRHVAENYPKHMVIFSATTNGTLVHGEIKEWVKQHSDIFVCALSLDGTKRMQDINRCGCFDQIDVDFFAKTWPKQPMKMTVSAQTLPYLSEGVIYMHENGYGFTCNLALDIDWSASENTAILERELSILIDYYLSHPDVTPCQLLSVPIMTVATADRNAPFRQCGAGEEMFTYDVDGSVYPCQFFMPVTLGEERAKSAKKLQLKSEITRHDFPAPCCDCTAILICHTCYGANLDKCGNPYQKDEGWCKLQKITFKANAYFLWKKYKNGTLGLSEKDEAYTLKAIDMIMNELD